MFCEIELSKSCVLEALTALDEGRDQEEVVLSSLAKAKVGKPNLVSRRRTNARWYQHDGRIDIGFFIKRAAVAEQTFGDVNFHRNRYGNWKAINKSSNGRRKGA